MDAGQVAAAGDPRRQPGLHRAGGSAIPGTPAEGRARRSITRSTRTRRRRYCHWNLPEAHALESWGDARAYDGTVTIVQPLIAPLYEGRTIIEVLGDVHRRADRQVGPRPREGLLDARAGGKVAGWTITDPPGQPFTTADSFWKHALHDGFVTSRRIAGSRTEGRKSGAADLGSLDTPDLGPRASDLRRRRPRDHLPPRSDDLGWTLREQRLAAGAAEAADARSRGIRRRGSARGSPSSRSSTTVISSSCVIAATPRGSRSPSSPAIPTTRSRCSSATAASRTGRVGTPPSDVAKEFNVYRLRTSDAPWFGGGLEIAKTGGRYMLAQTQEHHLMEGPQPGPRGARSRNTARSRNSSPRWANGRHER